MLVSSMGSKLIVYTCVMWFRVSDLAGLGVAVCVCKLVWMTCSLTLQAWVSLCD